MNPRRAEKKLNVHAARDGTAAGRYGGAPREHLIFLITNNPPPKKKEVSILFRA